MSVRRAAADPHMPPLALCGAVLRVPLRAAATTRRTAARRTAAHPAASMPPPRPRLLRAPRSRQGLAGLLPAAHPPAARSSAFSSPARQARRYHDSVSRPPPDKMMVVQYGHQLDVVYTWLKRGQHCVWLGDFGVGMEVYASLDRRLEAEWVARNGGTAPATFEEYLDYAGQKRVFDNLWIPNPFTVLPNAYNDSALTQWIATRYPPANFEYLPFSVYASLVRSYHRTRYGYPYSSLGMQNNVPRMVKVLHGVDPVPVTHPPARLLKNFLIPRLKGSGSPGEMIRSRNLRVLCPNAGRLAGVIPLTILNLKHFRGSMHCIDADEDSVDNIRFNHTRLKHSHDPSSNRFRSLKAEVSHRLLPRKSLFKRFNMAVLTPSWMPPMEEVPGAAEAMQGYYDLDGQEEGRDFLFGRQMFADSEEDDLAHQLSSVDAAMDADGLVLVVWSNLRNIVFNTADHPVVSELERNERYTLEHFEDIPWRVASPELQARQGMPFLKDLNNKLRVELWVLRVNRPLLPPPAQSYSDFGDALHIDAGEQTSLVAAEAEYGVTAPDNASLHHASKGLAELGQAAAMQHGVAGSGGVTITAEMNAARQRTNEAIAEKMGVPLDQLDQSVLSRVKPVTAAKGVPRDEMLDFFEPQVGFRGDYNSTKKRIKLDKRVASWKEGNPVEEGLEYSRLLKAKRAKEADVRHDKSEKKKLMMSLGLRTKMPNVLRKAAKKAIKPRQE